MSQRHYVGFTSRGPTVFHNVLRAPTGEILVLLDEDEIKKLELDFRAWLNSGETVSTPTVTAENVTVSTATASPLVTLTLSAATSYDLDGAITIVVPFSSGEQWRGIIRVRRTERYMDEDSPRDYA
jgi:pyocin large subunit-like protein